MILISGEALIDLIPDPVKANAYDAVLGGSPYNVAIGLARLGGAAAFVSRLSADANGEALAASLAETASTSLVARDLRPTTLAFVMRGTAKTGSRYSFYIDATAYDGPWPFPAEWPEGAITCMSARSPPSAPAMAQSVVAALTAARPHASISFDPNIRPLVTPDRDAVARLVERQASLAHLVKASQEDLEWLYPGRAIEDSLAAWAAFGPRFCIATLGARGALAYLGKERMEISAPRVEVVDTVGAGDSFMSALLSAMDRDGALGPDAPAPSRSELESWLRFAARRLGDHLHPQGLRPADRKEVEAALAA